MSRLLLLLPFLLLNTSLFGQSISLEKSETLFEHPRMENTGLGYPFIPLDYNSDGITDFIGSTFNDQFIYKGTGNNGFEQIDIYQGFSHNPLKVMDFDKDGDDDIIMERYINIYVSADSFFFFNPDIPFQQDIIEVADFNGDGLNDFLTHRTVVFENDELIIHYNQGNNEFDPVIIYDKYDYEDVEIGDIDNDGDIDMAVMLVFEDNPMVLLFNEGASFREQEITNQFDAGSETVKLRDLDSDNDLDIITLGSFDNIYILENVDNYSTEGPVRQINLSDVLFFNMADLDQDGKQDIVALTSPFDGFKITTIKGEGGFNFGTPVEWETFTDSDFFGFPNANYMANNLFIYDYDLDGLVDVIYTDGFDTPNQVKWLKNNSDITSSIEELKPLSSYTVAPNPAQDYIQVSGDDVSKGFQYEILSINGKRIRIGNATNDRIRIADLEAGMYIIQSEDLRMVERFVKF